MKSDGPGVPSEGIVVMIQTVPARVQRSVRTIRSGRCAEFLRIAIFRNAESRFSREDSSHIKFPIARADTGIELLRDWTMSQVQACLAGQAVLFCLDRLID